MFCRKNQLSTKLFVGLLILTTLGLVSLTNPLPSLAGPQFGLTPTLTPLPPSATPSPTPPAAPTREPDTAPPEQVEVQLGCNLTCSVDGSPLATEVEVQLIHQGSGWIAEGTINNQNSTIFQVPYPDQWDVYLIAPPRFASTGEISTIEQVPHYLGTIQANSGRQTVACPLSCLASPLDLPTTGGHSNNQTTFIFNLFILLCLLSGGLLMRGGILMRPGQVDQTGPPSSPKK